MHTVLTTAAEVQLLDATSMLPRADENSPRMVAVLAHAACDLQTEEVLHRLVTLRGHRPEDMEKLVSFGPQFSLRRDGVRQFYTELSGDDPVRHDWWQPWLESGQRRNRAAHGGGTVQHNDALATLDACRSFVQHLRMVCAMQPN